jgi:hypothetical protein
MKSLFALLVSLFFSALSFSQGLALPYNTGFDSAPQQAGWQQYRTGFLSGSAWSYGGGAFSVPTCVSHDYNVGGNTTDTVVDWFISPPINFTNVGTMSIKVQTGGFSTPFPDSFEILFGTDHQDPATGNFVVIANLSYMLPQYQWLDTTFSIPFASDSGYIALKYKTIGAAWSTYSFDNISMDVANASIDENNPANATIRCLPNPFSTQTVLRTGQTLNDATLMIYNSQGQQVKKMEHLCGENILLDRDNLPAGLYFAKLEQAGKVFTGRLVVVEN